MALAGVVFSKLHPDEDIPVYSDWKDVPQDVLLELRARHDASTGTPKPLKDKHGQFDPEPTFEDYDPFADD